MYRVNYGVWRRLEYEVKGLQINSEGELVLSFEYLFGQKTDKVEFAYTYPYTYQDCQNDVMHLKELHEGGLDIYFKHHPLVKSVENRNIDLIMISSHEGKDGTEVVNDPYILTDQKLAKFKSHKPVVMITARVHPL